MAEASAWYHVRRTEKLLLAQVLSKRESLPPPAGAGEEADVHVGFWRNPKRFNVAITRARALLVVVGHPVVLMEVRCPALAANLML